MEKFFSKVSEETLHNGVVVAVGFAGHRLNRAGVVQEQAPGRVLILESLVRMHEGFLPLLKRD